jgi:hypothetical protein
MVQTVRVAGRAGLSGRGPRHIFANIKTPGNVTEFHMAVGESWVKRNGR